MSLKERILKLSNTNTMTKPDADSVLFNKLALIYKKPTTITCDFEQRVNDAYNHFDKNGRLSEDDREFINGVLDGRMIKERVLHKALDKVEREEITGRQKSFVLSVAEQFEQRGFISSKQYQVLKEMII
jgi:hypothetical protein